MYHAYMDMVIYLTVIPIALLFMPWVLVRYIFITDHTRSLPYMRYARYMWLAGALWVLAMTLPNLQISDQTNTTTMHALGGAVAATLFAYGLRVYQIRFTAWWQPAVWLYLFVSGLGVANELFEFFLDSSGLSNAPKGDEWWDLLTNTIGGFIAFTLINAVWRLRRTTRAATDS